MKVTEARNELYKIYALSDPRLERTFNNIRYVGKTRRPLWFRLSGHKQKLSNDYRSCWIKSLLSKGIEPAIWPLAFCCRDNWQQIERAWIQRLRPIANLTNLTNGGDGIDGYKLTPEQRIRHGEIRKGKAPSREARLKISLALRGRKKPPFSAEQLLKFRLAKLGKRQTPQHIANAAATRIGTMRSMEVKAKLSTIQKQRWQAGLSRQLHSPECRAKAAASNTGKKRSKQACLNISKAISKPVKCVETGQIFQSAKIAGESLGKTYGGRLIHRAIKNGIAHAGFHWTRP